MPPARLLPICFALAISIATLIPQPAVATDVTTVPVDALDRWTRVAFRRIPANDVSADSAGLLVSVRGSASPLVYRFDKPLSVTGFRVSASWQGQLDLPLDVEQGEPSADDFLLKFGLVEAGERRLGWLQRRLAPGWVRTLHDLAPKGTGIRRVLFFSSTQTAEQVGTQRVHPLNDLLEEQRIVHVDKPGAFVMQHTLSAPITTLGLWLSIDGDDTGSAFALRIKSIELITAPAPTATAAAP